MTVGQRIKRARKFRGITQKELGLAVGLEEKNADVRIAQYESDIRKPKEDLIHKMAKALDVNWVSLTDPSPYTAEGIMNTLFDIDEMSSVYLYEVEEEPDPAFPYYPDKHMAVSFHYKMIDDFFREWQIRKQELANKEITKEEYMEWKLNWPATCDDCGKYEPKYKWRKNNE